MLGLPYQITCVGSAQQLDGIPGFAVVTPYASRHSPIRIPLSPRLSSVAKSTKLLDRDKSTELGCVVHGTTNIPVRGLKVTRLVQVVDIACCCP
jgi:hypothetical protein